MCRCTCPYTVCAVICVPSLAHSECQRHRDYETSLARCRSCSRSLSRLNPMASCSPAPRPSLSLPPASSFLPPPSCFLPLASCLLRFQHLRRAPSRNSNLNKTSSLSRHLHEHISSTSSSFTASALNKPSSSSSSSSSNPLKNHRHFLRCHQPPLTLFRVLLYCACVKDQAPAGAPGGRMRRRMPRKRRRRRGEEEEESVFKNNAGGGGGFIDCA